MNKKENLCCHFVHTLGTCNFIIFDSKLVFLENTITVFTLETIRVVFPIHCDQGHIRNGTAAIVALRTDAVYVAVVAKL